MLFTFFSINNISKYLIFCFLFFFSLIIVLNSPFGWHNNEVSNVDTSAEIILARLSRAMAELSAMKSQNEELRNLIQTYIPLELNAIQGLNNEAPQIPRSINNEIPKSTSSVDDNPNQDYELSRRSLSKQIEELYNYISHSDVKPKINQFVKELTNNLHYELDVITQRDELWRSTQLMQLSSYFQEKIHKLQNPVDCERAKKLVCNLNKGCGFGCQIHHLIYCTIVSMATNRTLILNSHNWRYVKKKFINNFDSSSKSLWDLVFKPLSSNCLEDSGSSRAMWSLEKMNEKTQVIDLPIIDSLKPRPGYLPLVIPEQLSSQLITLHGAPFLWFIGQIVKFLMRPSSELEEFLKQKKSNFSFHSPIVGVHVRRTDKINTEASFHPLSEYMVHVEEYFDKLDYFRKRQNKEPVNRVVYLATDDLSVWKKETKVFERKGYNFIGDSEISNTASVNRRYSFDSLKNIILDVWLLSETDFLVCTFSSQVGRLAYELMQAKNPSLDKSSKFCSLDDIYYFGGQSGHNQVAVVDHKAQSSEEISFKKGDIIGIAGNHWNGYSKGLNRASQKQGLYPGFKTEEKIDVANFELFKKME